jgi:hypothetical protein
MLHDEENPQKRTGDFATGETVRIIATDLELDLGTGKGEGE